LGDGGVHLLGGAGDRLRCGALRRIGLSGAFYLLQTLIPFRFQGLCDPAICRIDLFIAPTREVGGLLQPRQFLTPVLINGLGLGV
jgi:hypothetical protein